MTHTVFTLLICALAGVVKNKDGAGRVTDKMFRKYFTISSRTWVFGYDVSFTISGGERNPGLVPRLTECERRLSTQLCGSQKKIWLILGEERDRCSRL